MEQILESLSVIFISPFRDRLAGLLWCVFVSALLVLFYLFFRRRTLGRAISELTSSGAVSPESAKAITDEKCKKALEKSSDRLVEKIETEGGARYYIPESRAKKAQYFLKASGSGVKSTLLSVAALYAALVALYYILPFVFPEYFGNL